MEWLAILIWALANMFFCRLWQNLLCPSPVSLTFLSHLDPFCQSSSRPQSLPIYKRLLEPTFPSRYCYLSIHCRISWKDCLHSVFTLFFLLSSTHSSPVLPYNSTKWLSPELPSCCWIQATTLNSHRTRLKGTIYHCWPPTLYLDLLLLWLRDTPCHLTFLQPFQLPSRLFLMDTHLCPDP